MEIVYFFLNSRNLVFIILYLIGAFPSGLLISKLMGVDIRRAGSGNVGATNIARILGKRAGVLTLLLDISKGLTAMLIATHFLISAEEQALAAVIIVLGHTLSFPPILKGGKGVATALGVILIASPIHVLIALAVFAISFYLSKIVSLSSILAAATVGITSFNLNDKGLGLALLAIATIVILRHTANIKRLLVGAESKFTTAR